LLLNLERERASLTKPQPYGYRTEELPSGKRDAHGRSIPAGYRIVIHGDEAGVVRRIFELYLSDDGFRTIAHRLNRERVPSPRAKGWSSSAVRVILTNPLYKGEQVWNRSEWIKDHERGKRRRFERPESDWIRQEAPELAIVDPAIWEAVRAAMERKRRGYEWRPHGGLVTTHRGAGHPGPARHVLSGLLECGVCHGGFHAVNRAGCYACGWRRDRGPEVCSNALRLARVELEARVLGACRERILTPEGLLYAVDRAVAIVRERRRGLDPGVVKARLEEIEREAENLARFAAKTGRVDEAAGLYGELDSERRRAACAARETARGAGSRLAPGPPGRARGAVPRPARGLPGAGAGGPPGPPRRSSHARFTRPGAGLPGRGRVRPLARGPRNRNRPGARRPPSDSTVW